MDKKTTFLFHTLIFSFLFILLTVSSPLKAQVVWENPQNEIYHYLEKLSQKGIIEFDDVMRPISRKTISEKLNELQNSISLLTPVERKELAFYKQEYSEFDSNLVDSTYILKKDQAGRLRALTVKKGNFLLRGDPAIVAGIKKNNLGTSYITGTGLKFWGQVGKHIGFQAYYQDFSESGKGFDSLRTFSPEPGIVKINTINQKVLNYTDFRGNITYNWNNGSVSLGMDKLLWGYGQNGRIVLSDKAPAYPFFRLDYKPLDWLSFNYSHLWLQSGILDSAKSYPKGNDIYGSERERFVSKFMATHSLNFFPLKGLSISLGESMVYSDGLDIGYLFPLMFFKIYDQHSGRNRINASSNAQFFFQANSRNHIRNTHLYTTLFIDEIRTSTIFDKQKSRNQLGYTLGASVADIAIPNLLIGAEYTRINPFAYKNLIPAQTYTNQNYLLGDWMGDNSDRIIAYASYTPLPRLKTHLQFQKIRKGNLDELDDQYYAEPQPVFLMNLERKDKQVLFKVSYEWINNLYLDAQYTWNEDQNVISQKTSNPQQFEIKMRLGL
jgi:hypothetical protein